MELNTQINKIYTNIATVFEKQGRVIPLELIYGDGSKFNKAPLYLWELTYNEILKTLTQWKQEELK